MLGKALSEPCSEDLGPGPASTSQSILEREEVF